MDIASFQRFPKEKLLRLVVMEGRLIVDIAGNRSGRGHYLKKDEASLELALKKKAFHRLLHRPLDESELRAIKEAL